jgi:hypothetical protein
MYLIKIRFLIYNIDLVFFLVILALVIEKERLFAEVATTL